MTSPCSSPDSQQLKAMKTVNKGHDDDDADHGNDYDESDEK